VCTQYGANNGLGGFGLRGPRGHFVALALRAAVTVFGIISKSKKYNKIIKLIIVIITNNLCVINNE